ncbi:MAG TPA: DUF1810 domain-containing protein [Devosia sp.]|jgi:uncharacterized protein (DUF1810 family)|nr:DUF1810 domain-containing protein [Devosia sp.]
MFEHFVEAQEPVYREVLAELRAGRKTSHWMWFIFPQLKGLGRSPTALHFGLDGLPAAEAYLRHPVLGPRLLECTRTVLAVEGRTAHDIFGSPDDLKFRSSVTLFGRADPAEPAFRAALAKFYGGRQDERTLELLGA